VAVAADSLSGLVAKWNTIPGIIHCRSITAARKIAYRVRASDPTWLASVDEALSRIGASRFCHGDGDRGWIADLDWFLRPGSVAHLIEGKYDDRQQKPADPRGNLALRNQLLAELEEGDHGT